MLKGLFGKYRLNKNKWQLAKEHDITLDELGALLTKHKSLWVSWKFSPTKSGNVELHMFHKTLAHLDDAFTALYNKLEEGSYVVNDSTREPVPVKLDDWLSDQMSIPIDVGSYLNHLTEAMENLSLLLDRKNEKQIRFYNRNAYFLRKDIQSLLRLISEI